MNYGFSVSHSMANETVLEVELPDHGPLRDLKVRIVRGDNQSHGGGGAAGPPGPGEAAPNAVVLKIRLRVPSLADAATDTGTLDALATLRLVVADREALLEAGLAGSGTGKVQGLTRLRQPISMRNERAALVALQQLVEAALDGYPRRREAEEVGQAAMQLSKCS